MGTLACSTVTMGALASGFVFRVALASTDFMGALAYSNSTANNGTLACGAVIMGTLACSTPCMGTLSCGSAFRIIMESADFMGTFARVRDTAIMGTPLFQRFGWTYFSLCIERNILFSLALWFGCERPCNQMFVWGGLVALPRVFALEN